MMIKENVCEPRLDDGICGVKIAESALPFLLLPKVAMSAFEGLRRESLMLMGHRGAYDGGSLLHQPLRAEVNQRAGCYLRNIWGYSKNSKVLGGHTVKAKYKRSATKGYYPGLG